MRELIDQIEGSLGTPFYFLSLAAALTVPDIAGALASDDGLASGAKYAAWFESYVRPQFVRATLASVDEGDRQYLQNLENPLSGEICYRFRCSFLHQGTTEHPKSPYAKVIFVEPGTTGIKMHYNVIRDVLNIDLPSFCREMIAGAREWLDSAENTDHYQKNYERFVRLHPSGLKPYIVGVPVIG